MELRVKFEGIWMTYGIKLSYRSNSHGFEEMRNKMELRGKFKLVLRTFGLK
jgi:hypothetical protein